ncbi:hypothetical protein NJI34_36965 [Pseudomonas sp. S 311-6]|nr:hypothetical protein [Pseudomonas sp. S 311-6]
MSQIPGIGRCHAMGAVIQNGIARQFLFQQRLGKIGGPGQAITEIITLGQTQHLLQLKPAQLFHLMHGIDAQPHRPQDLLWLPLGQPGRASLPGLRHVGSRSGMHGGTFLTIADTEKQHACWHRRRAGPGRQRGQQIGQARPSCRQQGFYRHLFSCFIT